MRNPSMSRAPHASLLHGRRQRGAALVETVLLMLVLIPLLLYSLFLMDAAYMKLDLQETVVSGLWDFSTRNSEKGASKNDDAQLVARAVRATYSDHTSAFDDGAEVGVDGYNVEDRIFGRHNHSKHHKIYFAAQYTFRFKEEFGSDTEFLCSLSQDSDWAKDATNLVQSFADSEYNRGGKVFCEATGFIYNYIIPEKLFQEFTEVKMSDLTKRATNSDSHDFQGTGGNIVAHETGSLYYHTWALRNGSANGNLDDADIGVRGSLFSLGGDGPSKVEGPFYDRVVFGATEATTYDAVQAASVSFANTADSSDLLSLSGVEAAGPKTRDIGGLPNPHGVYLVARYKPQSPGQKQKAARVLIGGQEYQSTPYKGINNDYSTAYSKRGVYYMGCRQEEQEKCP